MLFDLFKKKTIVKSDNYFGIILKEGEGSGLIIQLDATTKSVKLLDEKKFTYSNGWEQLIEDIDQVLYDLEQRNNITIKKVIFFLYSHLIDQSTKQIKKAYDNRIKSVTKELEIEPLGFIEYHEAIALYQGFKEEVPLTSIIVELDTPVVSLFIYKAGELFFSDSVGRSDNIVADLEVIFDKIKGTVLPARIILYDSTTLITESHKIISHKFDEDLFIQLPKVEVYRQDDVMNALLHSFSKQFFADDLNHAAMSSALIEQAHEPIAETVGTLDKPENTQSDAMGFVIGRDIQDEIVPRDTISVTEDVQMSDSFEQSGQQTKPNIIQNALSFVYGLPKKINMPSSPMKLTGKAIPLIGLALIMVSTFILFFFLHKATLTVYFDGKKEEKEMTIDGTSLSVQKVDKTIETSATKDATGKKTIGQKATGAVMIYNKDAGDKTFKKGDVLTSVNNIKFVLDTDVKVASASESLTSEGNVLTVTGKAKAQITAQDIGPEGNIAKGQKLKIGDFSENLFFAMVETPLTGGTKKDVQTVSKDDYAGLKAKAIAVMKQEKESADKKNGAGQNRSIEKLADVKITEEQYSKEVGEEATSVMLKAKGVVTLYQYDNDKMKSLILSQFKETVSSDYDLSTSNISYVISDATNEKDTITITVAATARLIQKNDISQIKRLVAGKSKSALDTIMKDTIKAQGFTMNVDTSLPFMANRLPFFTRNIEVHIDSL